MEMSIFIMKGTSFKMQNINGFNENYSINKCHALEAVSRNKHLTDFYFYISI
jgi:copper homeostasis protein CutC